MWSASLANYALAWARNLASQGCALRHGGNGNAGQNLYAVRGNTAMSCVSATDGWYNEVSQYKFTRRPWTDNQPNFSNIGHFTQLVWKSSTQLGCGAAKGANNCYVVACHYSPAGNMVGDSSFYANVLMTQ
ncbi:hypothetical protein PLESTM_000943500 [Pleodorina starrii]|nr:hypothetical protein PLESTM_000943500 [Pleodorina starrii]